ncbi:MAG TPA: SH3 domain-containing protein [Thermomicrobiales bacterium]|nr:SH3 domain-containing protein [Thermomicrobiales bacterium]
MVNPGLTRRLDQHGRRAGIAIGLTMVLVTLLLIGGFITIYGRLDPLLSDFIAANVPTEPVPTALPATDAVEEEDEEGAPATETPAETEPAPVTATASDSDDDADAEPTPTEAEDTFEPDYRIASGEGPINFREIPSLLGNEPITSLPPGTPLEFLGDEQDDRDNFAENGTWLRFQLEDGTEGWVREIDVEPTGNGG